MRTIAVLETGLSSRSMHESMYFVSPVMGFEVSPPRIERVLSHASPLGAETMQEETPVADQFTLVVLPLLTSDGMTRSVRSAPEEMMLSLKFTF